jgi:DNA polymerase III alpha subunit
MDDVIISVALIRPGAANSGMKDTFIRRRAGLEPIRYLHPILEPLLKETLGVVIYQEQVMQIAHHVAGISLKEADYLRRAMTKHRDRKEIYQLRKQFIAGVRKKGVSLANASRLWNFLLNFTGYGFNKAHAATYGILAYQSAYLKKYFPVIFMTAVLNNEGGFYSRMAYMEEARRMGIKLLPPDINHSEAQFTCYEDQIRVGLLAVHELSGNTMQQILRERQRKSFSSLQDFLQRVKPAVNEALNLAKCGALRSVLPSESQAVLLIKLYYQNKKQWAKTALTANDIRLKPYNLFQRVFHEMELLNCAVSAHPLVLFRDKIPGSCIPSYQLEQYKNKKVDFCGWGVTSRTARTANGKVVKFLTLEDFFGIVEVVCWEDVYKKYSHLLKGHGPFVITGIVQARVKGELHMVAEKVQKIELSKKEWEQMLANGTSDEKKLVLQLERCKTDFAGDQKE